MIEIFEDVREEVKEVAETAWNLAIAQSNPVEAADFLMNIVSYYKNLFTEVISNYNSDGSYENKISCCF